MKSKKSQVSMIESGAYLRYKVDSFQVVGGKSLFRVACVTLYALNPQFYEFTLDTHNH